MAIQSTTNIEMAPHSARSEAPTAEIDASVGSEVRDVSVTETAPATRREVALAAPTPVITLSGWRQVSPPTAMARAAPEDGVVAESSAYEVAKRGLDILGSCVCLVLFVPVLGVIAASIKLEDRGPVIHRRQVVGRDGANVNAYKFRTMIPNADAFLAEHPDLMAEYAANVKLRRDPRITRVGAVLRRTSLDELPQLVNVLRGEMSLVGPRMIHPSEEPRYGPLAQTRRRVRPGITGLWQVSGRQDLSYEQRVALDRYYLRRRSFWFDVRILNSTVGALVRRRGAY